jgi:hypothetical protein
MYIEEFPEPTPNSASIWQDEKLLVLFQTRVPDAIAGFKLDEEDTARMEKYWPAGEFAAKEVSV